MNGLRNDWVKLDNATKLIEDGPINYLTDDEENLLLNLLDKMELEIRDQLSIKELGSYTLNKRGI